jgi:TRAP-type mannitol/chloroaromatic compound transport system substrate-binding protein
MRISGLAGKVYSELGVTVRLLPGGEIFPALESGVIDAAELSVPIRIVALVFIKQPKITTPPNGTSLQT